MKNIRKSIAFFLSFTLLLSMVAFYSCEEEFEEDFIEENRTEDFIKTMKIIYPEIKVLQERRYDLIDLQMADKNDRLKTAEINQELKYIENETERIMNPLLEKSYNLLIEYGFTQGELKKELESLNSPDIIYMAIVTLGFSNKKESNVPRLKSANVEDHGEKDWYDCLLRSVGIDAVIEIVNSRTLGSTAAKRLIKQAVRKIAARSLGWIGVGIAAYEFGDCMEWY